jgi:hypothetical protein
MPETFSIGACECCGGCSCANCEISDFLLEDSRESCVPEGTGFSILQGYQKNGLLSGSNGPAGVQYAAGYPGVLGNCDWFWWRADNSCLVAAGSLGFPGAYSYASTIREKWTLYKCEDGELTDITDTATTNGPFETLQTFGGGATGGESAACGGIACPDDPDSDFLEPTIDCNEFP